MKNNIKKVRENAQKADDTQRYIVTVTTFPEPEEIEKLTIEEKRKYLQMREELLKDADEEDGQFISYDRKSERDAIITALNALRILKKTSPNECLVDCINIHRTPNETEWTSFFSDWLVHSEVLKNL